jgi:hypothetical protein
VDGGAKILGVFRVKNPILRQKIIFFPILGGGGGAGDFSKKTPNKMDLASPVVSF